MSDWLIAGIALLALFVYALIERRAVDHRSREAWEDTQRELAKKTPQPIEGPRVAPVRLLEADRTTASVTDRAAS